MCTVRVQCQIFRPAGYPCPTLTNSHPEASSYTLNMPNSPNTFLSFHASELKRHVTNDPHLFPLRELAQPGPVFSLDGLEEYHVQEIIDAHKRGQGHQYLVQWTGYGPKHNCWLTGCNLEECAALDKWLVDVTAQ